MHYAILVIGEDIENQMAPFDENREVPRYKEPISQDDIDQAVKFFKDRRWLEWSTAPSADSIVRYEDQRRAAEATEFDPWSCYLLYNDDEQDRLGRDGDEFFRWSTYNPDGKWDYWRIGGRYTRRFLLKPGAEGRREPLSWEWTFNARHGGAGDDPEPPEEGVDQARKGEINFERMAEKSRSDADNAWRTFEGIVAEFGPLPQIDFSTASREESDSFFASPIVKAMNEAKLVGWDGRYEWNDFRLSGYEFIEQEPLHGMCPFYGYVHEGQWVEKESWNRTTKAFDETPGFYKKAVDVLLSLPDDTLLTVVDIHS
jgi:hypothetical protein